MSSKTKTNANKEETRPALAPKLRFPEFLGGGSWDDVPIATILNIRDERRLPSTDTPLYSLTIENGVTAKTDRYNREFLVRDSGNKKYKLVEPNDIVFNPSNLRWGAINYSQLTHSVVVSPIYEVLSLGDSSANFLEFIACSVMRGEQIRRFIIKGQGTLVERIAVKVEDFLSTKLPVPPTKAEQQKIAECLSSVDGLIAAQARKLDALKTHKKGLMQQLFPREGETQPRLRFPEFQNAGEWEEKTFSELCDIKHGYAFESEFFSNEGDYVLLTPGNFYEEGGYRDRGEKQKYYSGEISPAYVLAVGDMLVAMTEQAAGLLGSPIIVPESDKFLHNQRLGLVTKRPGVAWTNEFFFHVFNTPPVRKAIHATASGAKVRHTSPTKVGEVVVSVPTTTAEQQRIASCLSSLDALITAETQKHEALKTHKKGLMQQLFPSPEE